MIEPTQTPQPKEKRRFSPALLVFLLFPILGLLAAVAVALSSGGPGTEAGPQSTPAPVVLPTMPPEPVQLTGETAPDFELRSLDQDQVSLSDFRGRVVFLNFWATWCGPCERELPAFEAFMADQPADGPVVVGINLGETYDAVKPYLDERGVHSFPILLDINYEASDLYGIGPIPVTYVIDEAGLIRFSKYGEITAEDMQSYLDALAEA